MCLAIVGVLLISRPESRGLVSRGGGRIGIVFVEGPISGETSGVLGGQGQSCQLMVELRRFRDDPTVKAVVLRLNSPGGSAAAAQEIVAEVRRLREAGKVVVASMGDVAASGAYWIASACDHIVANPGTVTGSIGVIIQIGNLQELYQKLGIEFSTIKSGEHKDMGSPERPLTPEERSLFQAMVDDVHSQFVAAVVEGRKMPAEKVQELADGRIFTGQQAKDLGLVDSLGNLYDAIRTAKDLAGIPGEPELVYPARRWPWDLLGLIGGGRLVYDLVLPPGEVLVPPARIWP